jgi:hypothetical protein
LSAGLSEIVYWLETWKKDCWYSIEQHFQSASLDIKVWVHKENKSFVL